MRPLLIALGLFALCTPARADRPAKPPEPWVHLRVLEGATGGDGRVALQLTFTTTQQYSCMNYELPARLRVSGHELRVRLGDVQPPRTACLTALGPANGSVQVPPVAPGEYVLTLEHKGQPDRWRLSITAGAITLVPERARFSTTFEPEVKRRSAGVLQPLPH